MDDRRRYAIVLTSQPSCSTQSLVSISLSRHIELPSRRATRLLVHVSDIARRDTGGGSGATVTADWRSGARRGRSSGTAAVIARV
ncbi:hypothetical protein CERZMDRAFT_90846 [Cercospora zeae-maydis SCOH1-5]|uniref:Uncharacterized protein n=1 Tax=Cercospora zeae-maydis SCOH1-5 TaxID=717836 RepID=A0A6A6FE06_9PEZI|nr:hypothetical protein CERZMDRAFT_90846 [Cercospora zeae-maydis SCOH1-5]